MPVVETTKSGQRKRVDGTFRLVYTALRKSPGIPQHYRDIANDIGRPEQLSTVQSALSRMQQSDNFPVYRVASGIYVYRPNTENPVSAYPPEVTPKPKEREETVYYKPFFDPNAVKVTDPIVENVREEIEKAVKVNVNSRYGTNARRVYEYVGMVGAMDMLRNANSQLFLAIPVSEFLNLEKFTAKFD